MTLVHLIPHLRLGAGRYVVDLARWQAASGDRVLVFVSADAEAPFATDAALTNELAAAGIPTAIAGDFFHRDLDGLNATAAALRAPMTIGTTWLAHAHTAMAAGVARQAHATAVIGTCHGVATDRPASFDLQDALAWQLCDEVTTPARHWATRLEQRFGIAAPHVVPVGLDLTRYPRATRGAASSTLRLVTAAEQTHRKGLDLLLDALGSVWARGVSATCHLFGRGDAAGELARQASVIDPDGQRVVFKGHVDTLYSHLSEYDAFVLPSRSDNQPVAAIEAMLAGLPLIVSDVGGLGDLVRDGQCGWIVAPEHVAALADAIAAASDEPPSERRARGERGERFARKAFDADTTARALAAVYARALTRRRQIAALSR